MKRLIISLAIVALLVVVTLYSYAKIEKITDDMTLALNAAIICNINGDYETTTKMLEEHQRLFEQNEALFILFVDREHYNNMNTTLKGALPYIGKENEKDFYSEMQKTLRHIDVIRNNNGMLI